MCILLYVHIVIALNWYCFFTYIFVYSSHSDLLINLMSRDFYSSIWALANSMYVAERERKSEIWSGGFNGVSGKLLDNGLCGGRVGDLCSELLRLQRLQSQRDFCPFVWTAMYISIFRPRGLSSMPVSLCLTTLVSIEVTYLPRNLRCCVFFPSIVTSTW